MLENHTWDLHSKYFQHCLPLTDNVDLTNRRYTGKLYSESYFRPLQLLGIRPGISKEDDFYCSSFTADVYLTNRRETGKLYSESYSSVSVMFASIPDYLDFYTEAELNQGGVTCLKILNEIIAVFDKVKHTWLCSHQRCISHLMTFDFQLLFESQFLHRVEKIKIISATYMAACGLQPGRQRPVPKPSSPSPWLTWSGIFAPQLEPGWESLRPVCPLLASFGRGAATPELLSSSLLPLRVASHTATARIVCDELTKGSN